MDLKASTSRDGASEDVGSAFDYNIFLGRTLHIDIMGENGGEAANADDANLQMDSSIAVKVITMQISSAILAAKSPLFFKLFSNGMRESDQTHVTLRITASEEAPVIALLKFMNTNILNVTSPLVFLEVLVAADKFEVASCLRHCNQLLLSISMTLEFVLPYLDLPSSVLMDDGVQPLTDAKK
ncbi:putative chromatin remodeling & transcription regulator BTB-POZ family [Medicago truncatula]|nr:putative chromatin remodeling & transcription regulator BTB-POZ family [Medicago truncatula]